MKRYRITGNFGFHEVNLIVEEVEEIKNFDLKEARKKQEGGAF